VQLRRHLAPRQQLEEEEEEEEEVEEEEVEEVVEVEVLLGRQALPAHLAHRHQEVRRVPLDLARHLGRRYLVWHLCRTLPRRERTAPGPCPSEECWQKSEVR
jgi:hypothetical protein